MITSRTKAIVTQLHPKYKKKIKWIKGNVEALTPAEKVKIKAEIKGYFEALEDAGVITNTQFKCLYLYYTNDL